MKTFSEKQFKELASKNGELVISLYTPTSKQSTDSYQTDKTHFKNKLKAIGADLESNYNLEEEEIRRLLQPGQNLLEDYEFWKYNSDMLAYFIIDGEVEMYKVPIKIEEGTHFIGKRPFLLPLIPGLNNDGRFYLLYLDLNRIRLYQGSRNNIWEIELDPEEVAVSFTEEEKRDENQQSLQGQGGVGNAGAMFHGHGGGSGEDKKVTILNYFHRMTEMLEPKLYENPLPLFLAGVDYLIPLFHQASKYTHLKKGHISGTHNGIEQRGLQEKAWALAEGHFVAERESRKEDFGFKVSRNLAISKDYQKLIKAAITGVVDTLLVNNNHEHLWGTYNDDNFTVHLDDGPTGENHCLIDLAAVKVIENSGKVYMEEPKDMPEDTLIAGTLRYEV
ncbi:MAG: hypothetical protein WD426_09670 [Anditalea sp.]